MKNIVYLIIMENIVSILNTTFEDILPKLNGVYIGHIKSEMEAMFHLAYWLYVDKKMNDDEVHKAVFNIVPFTLDETTKQDVEFLIIKAKELC